jgi:hypothetical protein
MFIIKILEINSSDWEVFICSTYTIFPIPFPIGVDVGDRVNVGVVVGVGVSVEVGEGVIVDVLVSVDVSV